MVLRCDQFNVLRTQKVFLRAMLVPADKQSLAIIFFAQKNIPWFWVNKDSNQKLERQGP